MDINFNSNSKQLITAIFTTEYNAGLDQILDQIKQQSSFELCMSNQSVEMNLTIQQGALKTAQGLIEINDSRLKTTIDVKLISQLWLIEDVNKKRMTKQFVFMNNLGHKLFSIRFLKIDAI